MFCLVAVEKGYCLGLNFMYHNVAPNKYGDRSVKKGVGSRGSRFRLLQQPALCPRLRHLGCAETDLELVRNES